MRFHSIAIIVFVAIFTMSAVDAQCQPGDPGGGGVPVPFSGIEWLIGAGMLWGFRGIANRNRKK